MPYLDHSKIDFCSICAAIYVKYLALSGRSMFLQGRHILTPSSGMMSRSVGPTAKCTFH